MRRKLRRILVAVPLALIILSLGQVLILKWVPVFITPLMVERKMEYRSDDSFRTRHKWVKIEDISSNAVKAVITSEDNLFAEHRGFDFNAMKEAAKEHASGGRQRGGSTISQQTAKNVFTLGRHTYFRKGVEAYYTFLIERIWGKQRIMEVYLNVAEMGYGIYGIESASETFFNKNADQLTMREASLIAACLPNPLKMHPDKPSAYLLKRCNTITSLSKKLAYPEWVEGGK